MGAYYAACLKRKSHTEWKLYTSWQCGYGAKLLEHSSLHSHYISGITELILYRPAFLAWLCDYHVREDENDPDWDNVEEVKKWNPRISDNTPVYHAIYVNLTKKEFFDTYRLLQIIARKVEEGDLDYFEVMIYKPRENPSVTEYYPYILHPLPLLTNSEDDASGGGDYEGNYPLRKKWYRDLIVAVSPKYDDFLKKKGFRDITAKVPVPVDRDSYWYSSEEFNRFVNLVNFARYYGADSISEAIIRSYDRLNMIFPPENDKKMKRIFHQI